MTLQQLIGELITLSHAYPDTSSITLVVREYKAPLDIVSMESEDESFEIVLKG